MVNEMRMKCKKKMRKLSEVTVTATATLADYSTLTIELKPLDVDDVTLHTRIHIWNIIICSVGHCAKCLVFDSHITINKLLKWFEVDWVANVMESSTDRFVARRNSNAMALMKMRIMSKWRRAKVAYLTFSCSSHFMHSHWHSIPIPSEIQIKTMAHAHFHFVNGTDLAFCSMICQHFVSQTDKVFTRQRAPF